MSNLDDKIKTFHINIGNDGYGTAIWTASRQANDGDRPNSKYYLNYDPTGIGNYYSSEKGVGHFKVYPKHDATKYKTIYGKVYQDNSDHPDHSGSIPCEIGAGVVHAVFCKIKRWSRYVERDTVTS